jgi:uncharacterized RDD family membrane protein YckC
VAKPPQDPLPIGSDPGTTRTEIGRTLPATPAGAPAEPQGPLPVPGKRLAHGRLERPLGRGGMGEVWLATDTALDRPVAVKLLGRDVADTPAVRERFYREARAQARIVHANVGHIYFIGEQDGQVFFAMEYIEGESLSELLKRDTRLGAAAALAMVRQAALGLREAHRHGFIHRDVKPSNLMIDRHGAVKLVDFGLVKPQATQDVALTADSAAVLGTPLYMAPEQARGDAVDFRSDIYALGATLHHLVAGRPPFEGDTALKIVSRHFSEARPHLPETRKALPGLDALVDRMMAKAPADRFASYDDLLAAIDQASPDERPAGFWVRATAALVDFMAIGVTAGLIGLALRPFVAVSPLDDALLWLLAGAYMVITARRFGRTAGKALFELEIVPDGRPGRLTWRQAGVRALVQGGPFCVGSALLDVSDLMGDTARIVLLGLGFISVAWPLLAGLAALRRADRRTAWDRAAGTRVRYRRGAAATATGR